MSKRKRGDDADQQLLPFVERMEPSGSITSSPKLTAAKPVPVTPATTPTLSSTPLIPRSTDVPIAPRRWEWHFVWEFGRGLRSRFSSSDGRSWSEQTAWEAARHVIVHYGVPAVIGIAALLTNCSGVSPVTKDDWTPVIERAR
jgi:hypothetical protein